MLAVALVAAGPAHAQTDPGPPPLPDAVSGDPSAGPKPPEPPPAAPTPEAAAATETSPTPTGLAVPVTTPAEEPEQQGEFSRKGFYFSFGIGTSIIRWELDQWTNDSRTYTGGVTELVPATLLKIGAGAGPQTAAHFTNRIAWLSSNDPTAVDFHERVWTMSAISGLGVTHFLDRAQRSWYIGADIGVAQWLSFRDFEDDLGDLGIGLCAEVGYNFHKGLSFEHSVCWASVTSTRRGVDGATEIDAELGMPLTASFTLNYLK